MSNKMTMGRYDAFYGKRIFIAGHQGMVGQALVRALTKVDCQLLTIPRSNLDLKDQSAVRNWVQK